MKNTKVTNFALLAALSLGGIPAWSAPPPWVPGASYDTDRSAPKQFARELVIRDQRAEDNVSPEGVAREVYELLEKVEEANLPMPHDIQVYHNWRKAYLEDQESQDLSTTGMMASVTRGHSFVLRLILNPLSKQDFSTEVLTDIEQERGRVELRGTIPQQLVLALEVAGFRRKVLKGGYSISNGSRIRCAVDEQNPLPVATCTLSLN